MQLKTIVPLPNTCWEEAVAKTLGSTLKQW